MGLSSTTLAALKQFYDTDPAIDLTYQNNPFLALCAKKAMVGYTYEQPLWQRDALSRSADFATALANAGQGRVQRFSITDVPNYAFSKVSTQDILASKSQGKGAFFDLLTKTIDSSMHSLTRDLAIGMYGAGDGVVGRTTTGTTAGSIVLSNPQDVTNFEEGDSINTAATATGAIRSGTGVITSITGAGTATVTILYSGTITAIGTSDYIFKAGDAPNNTGNLLKMVGVAGYTGTAALWGVTRTLDSRRTSLLSIDYSAATGTPLPPAEILTDAAFKVQFNGGMPSHAFCNPGFMIQLVNDLAGKVVPSVSSPSDAPTVSFKGVQVAIPTAKGMIEVIPDINCPIGKMLVTTLDRWTLFYRGKSLVSPIDQDGSLFLRDNAADGIVFRSGFYGNMACSAPGHHALCTLQ